MDAAVQNANGSYQYFGLAANVINKNSSRYGHRLMLVPTDNGMRLYDATEDKWVWVKE